LEIGVTESGDLLLLLLPAASCQLVEIEMEGGPRAGVSQRP
jgi:hypothetical protein